MRVLPTVNEHLLEAYLSGGEPQSSIYEPQALQLVMGAGRKAQEDILLDRAEAGRVAVLRRRGGGGTALLSPGQVVLALVTEVDKPFDNVAYARTINAWFREALAELGVSGIVDRGISDLALGERKILGSSLYRRRRILFYQGSLLVENDLSLFSRYLAYPSRVPDYRAGRDHEAFCTTLRRQGYAVTVDQVIHQLLRVVDRNLPLLS